MTDRGSNWGKVGKELGTVDRRKRLKK